VQSLQCLSPLTVWVQIPLRRGVLDTTLCNKVCQWLAAGWWFSLVHPVSSINKADHQDITEMYRVHLAWAGFELTLLVVIGTAMIAQVVSCKSNYYTITTTTTPNRKCSISSNLCMVAFYVSAVFHQIFALLPFM
jgi:hypothetical protein